MFLSESIRPQTAQPVPAEHTASHATIKVSPKVWPLLLDLKDATPSMVLVPTMMACAAAPGLATALLKLGSKDLLATFLVKMTWAARCP